MNARISITVLLTLMTFIFVENRESEAMFGVAKITINIIDEVGNAIEDANVGVGFQYDKSWATDSTSIKGTTDSQGKFTASASTNGHVGARISKNGYYNSRLIYDFQESSLAGWKPWNPELKVILRKIENPVPMYARDTKQSRIEIPVDDKDVAFDLIAFDWLSPYGRGTVADLLFRLNLIDNGGDDFEYNLKVSFVNAFDGVIEFDEDICKGSVFKLPRIAPVEGYGKELQIYLKGLKRGARMSWKDNRHYIFRVRSEEENGHLKKAMYGKILSDIKLTSAKKKGGMPGIVFKYYLNPDYTRNLEFDPKRNLFDALPELEQVGIQ